MVYAANAQKMYKKNQIEASSPKQLVTLLYEGAIKNVRLAEIALENGDREKRNKHLIKAQNIITELSSSLDYEQGEEIAGQLGSLYDFMLGELLQANLKEDPEKLVTVRTLLTELLDVWSTI